MWLSASSAFAVTVWYQPTPFPAVKADGVTPINKDDVTVVHALAGTTSTSHSTQVITATAGANTVGGISASDQYWMFVKFDLTGLPQTVDKALLYLMPHDLSLYTPTSVGACLVTGAWNSSTTWNSRPSFNTCYGWFSASPNSWTTIWLTGAGYDWYNQWQSGALAKSGIMLFPQAANNNFDAFYSTRYNDYARDAYADARRPALSLTFTPTLTLKMPLPGIPGPERLSWLVTNEVGGYECKGEGGNALWPDPAHTDAGSSGNYYSIDISWTNDGYTYGQYNTPVLAAAGGIVAEVGGGNNPGNLNGYYIAINHNGSQNPNVGFTTRYLHLKQTAARANGTLLVVGNSVNQGDQIGIVGTTGKDASGNPMSTAEHLHFGVRYQNQGYSYIPQLSKVVMEGMLLKSYQTECAVNANGVPTSRIRYYSSTNIPTGR